MKLKETEIVKPCKCSFFKIHEECLPNYTVVCNRCKKRYSRKKHSFDLSKFSFPKNRLFLFERMGLMTEYLF